MSNARSIDEVVSVVRSQKNYTVTQLYYFLTKNDSNFEFDIDAATDHGKLTLLHAACMTGNAEIIKTLLIMGALPNQLSSDGKTALLIAIASGNLACVKLLVNYGARLDIVIDEHCKTVLDHALEMRSLSPDIQSYLLSLPLHHNQDFKSTKYDKSRQFEILFSLTDATEIAKVIQKIESKIAAYRRNAESWFSINNGYKADKIQLALDRARLSKMQFKTMDEFLNYRGNGMPSINDALEIKRIGLLSPDSKTDIDSLVKTIKEGPSLK
jgi:ankyrin repeat protein